jgi:tRNA (cmo5U34)-methyltransferase
MVDEPAEGAGAMTEQPTNQRDAPGWNAGHYWQQDNVVAQFVEQTTAHADQRRVQFDFACDLFPFATDAPVRVLDLGAGYGAFAAAVLDRFPKATAVGVDISEPMVAVGRERMARFGDRFAYQIGDLTEGALPADLPGPFDAVVASAFVSHLLSKAKQRMYAEVFRILNPGGCFFNVDLVAPANEEMQAWYRAREERERQHGGDQPEATNAPAPMQHHHGGSAAHYLDTHHLETEAGQLAFLRTAGFVQVDCFYKRLLETVIGGYKPPPRGR